MAKRRTVVVPDYPKILVTPADWNRAQVLEKLLDALLAHYRLAPLPPPSSRIGDMNSGQEFNERLASLAFCQMQDFVPAFKKKPKVGAPKQEHTQKDGLFRYAHEARLVQIVRALRDMLVKNQMPSTNMAAYNQLLQILKAKPAPRWRYGKLNKANAFAQAWKSIPDNVKADPDLHFPTRSRRLKAISKQNMELVLEQAGPSKGAAAFSLMNVHLKTSSFNRLVQVLPPIPSKLASSGF